MKRVNLLATIAISFGLASLVSCTTDLTTATNDSLTSTAVDESQAATTNDQVVSTADDYLNSLDATGFQAVKGVENSSPEKTSIKLVVDSVTITVDRVGLNDYPKNICIDFGTGVTVKRGNRLKGKIYITISARMSVTNSTRTFLFSNFYVNDNSVKGTKTVTYSGLNNASQPYWTISATDTITRADGKKIVWNSKRVRTRIDTNNTPLIYWDDTYSITGGSTGVNANGVAYTMAIQETNPLIISQNFPYFTKGTVVITSENKTVVVDYGDGTKDAIATRTIDGVTKQFNLKK
jgi:hypothetical protein